ncbi:MAG: hypothetical protein NVSMB1_09440 [Polyangiales bacterium]
MKYTETPPAHFERAERVTTFTAILARLLRATRGALGAALVDAEGEAVDYGGSELDPDDLKIAAAHWRIVLQDIEGGAHTARWGAPTRLTVRTARRTFVMDALPDGYALLTVLHRRAFGHAHRALDAALRDLYGEAGWASPPSASNWYEIEVETRGHRPLRVRGAREQWHPLQVIGKVAVGLRRGELGYRVRVLPDRELTFIFGLDGHWYGDVPPSEIM